MKRRRRGLGIAVLFGAAFIHAASVGVAAQGAKVLTLAQAVDEALAKNDRLINQHDTIDAGRPRPAPGAQHVPAQGRRRTSSDRSDRPTSAARPIASTCRRSSSTGTELRLGVGHGVGADSRTPSAVHGQRHLLLQRRHDAHGVSQPLLRGFGRSVTRRSLTSAELRRDDAGRQQTLAEQQVAIDVASAYYRVVSQQAFVEVARQSLRALAPAARRVGSQARRRPRVAARRAARAAAGGAGRDPVLRRAVGGRRCARSADVPDGPARRTSRSTSSRRFRGREPSRSTSPTPSRIALDNRLDLKSRAAASADADHQVRFARNQLLPQVDVNFALTRRETAEHVPHAASASTVTSSRPSSRSPCRSIAPRSRSSTRRP